MRILQYITFLVFCFIGGVLANYAVHAQSEGYAPPQIFINGVEVKAKDNKINIFIDDKVGHAVVDEGLVSVLHLDSQ